MRWYTYNEPSDNGDNEVHTVNEEWIMVNYFPWWSGEMRRRGKGPQISKENCIEDWIVTHWAWESDRQGRAI